MKPGDKVQATQEWAEQFGGGKRFAGTLHRIDDTGPVIQARTHVVDLEEEFNGIAVIHFDPKDLELR